MPRCSTDPGLSDRDRDVLRRLEKTGWFVNKILADESGPGFAYSFGLYESFGHPEVIVYGLPLETMHALVNLVGNHARSGVRFVEGEQTDALLQDFTCCFRRVDPRWYKETLTWTMWYYQHSDFPTLQLFWPDQNGHFPWEPDCEASVRDAQPI